ncbi:hypothetical protein [Columbia Basin potato purple top phytoplasma]|uniref:Uncharacterized protein n=1 Tax=Columbia Basin potato purple top phytoplasma TaxID=307134 RepID=A0ABT5L9F9_9MOLU|nr:hypothetical protein [Columbia Basin potato purple top phytoplasma]MDC9032231.1 hypothetical protein [Columbia Basin potato purple top phytoplasma]
MDAFQQETQSNFKKINENIDKLEEMIINQNKSKKKKVSKIIWLKKNK